MYSNPFTFGLRYNPPDEDLRMRELDNLISSGKGDLVLVPKELVADVVQDEELYAVPNELRRLDYLRNAGRYSILNRELAMFRRRWESRRVNADISSKILRVIS